MKKTRHNPYSKGTQNYLILEHLFTRGSISQVEAQEVYKIRRLASRISELKNDGFILNREMKKDLAGQRYVRYSW